MSEKIFSPQNWERLIGSEREKILPVNLFLNLAKPKLNEFWADVGCGPGYFTLPIAEKVHKVYAIDISEEMLTICKRRASEKMLQNIEYIQIKDENIPIGSDLLDHILLVNVFHEFDYREKILTELKRALKRTGSVYLIDWKYEKMDFGPPLEHRLRADEVIKDFIETGYVVREESDIYRYNYVLVFGKAVE